MSIFFTSDLHLGHGNVIRYTNRPFNNAAEMDEALVRYWNETVAPHDEVYVVGDFALCPVPRAAALARRMNGRKFLVRGNHDKNLFGELLEQFGWVRDMHTVRVPDADTPRGAQEIVLCHYAMRVWNKSHHGAWHLYGHSHGSLPDDPHARSLDVGVDCWHYRPVSYQQIKERMALKTPRSVDHHRHRDL